MELSDCLALHLDLYQGVVPQEEFSVSGLCREMTER
jgi:hypothetical protein